MAIAVAGVIASGLDGRSVAEPDEGAAYTLAREWDELWLRIFDRGGRPNPDGPMLQRFFPPMDERYELDLRTAELPMDIEGPWAGQRTGARIWVQSLNELELATQAELRFEMPAWPGGYIWLDYQRREDWHTRRDVLRMDFGHRDIAGSGVDAAFRIYPRLEKDDIDLEGIVRCRVPGRGEATLRVGALDPFLNASFGLIEAKGRVPDEDIRQIDPPLTLSLSARTERFFGIRSELYAGAVVPQRRRHEFVLEPARDHIRHRRALLFAGLLEYRLPHAPHFVGAEATGVDATMEWAHTRDPARDLSVREATVQARAYARGDLGDDVQYEAALGQVRRPEWWDGPGRIEMKRSDREWRWSLRARWDPGRVGVMLRYLGAHRSVAGLPALGVSGFANRLQTHITLRLGDDIYTNFGAGWTWDPDTGFYDRAGMTLLYMPR